MNRNFLIFLMVATALMVAVIGNQPRPVMPGYMPWEVKVLDNGSSRIFGITLRKTRIQDANQILSSFPKNQMLSYPGQQAKLYAIYDQLNLGGFLVRLELEYDLNQAQLQQLSMLEPSAEGADEQRDLPDEIQMSLLNTTIVSINYIPQVDYDIDLLLQHFGQPDQRVDVDERHQQWIYNSIGLSIDIDNQGPDIFTYQAIKNSEPMSTPVSDQPADQPAS